MGMTWDQFWEQDSEIAVYYRKAHEIRQEQMNRDAWLQGMYVYEAIADLAPILHAFAKKGTKARKYSEKPYEFRKPEKKNQPLDKKDAEAKAAADKIRAKMLAGMKQINKQNAERRVRESFNAIGTVKTNGGKPPNR